MSARIITYFRQYRLHLSLFCHVSSTSPSPKSRIFRENLRQKQNTTEGKREMLSAYLNGFFQMKTATKVSIKTEAIEQPMMIPSFVSLDIKSLLLSDWLTFISVGTVKEKAQMIVMTS